MSTATQTRSLSPARRAVLVIGGIFAIAVIAGGTWGLINQLGQTTDERRLTLTPTGQRLTIDADGDVRIDVGTGTDVQVTERIRHAIGRPRVEETSTPDGVALRGNCPWYASNCSVDFVVTVPASISVDVDSSAGNVTVAGLAGSARLHSSAGDVRASGLRGEQVEARSSAGDVTLGFDAPPTTVIAHSSAGDVEIRLPDIEGGYQVHANTSAGDEKVDVANDPASGRRIDATSSAGDVTIRSN
jgi:hypothetical protein